MKLKTVPGLYITPGFKHSSMVIDVLQPPRPFSTGECLHFHKAPHCYCTQT